MTTAGSNITKSNITASMAALKSTYNTGIVWHSGNNPFSQSNPIGGDNTGYTSDYAADISDTNITASTIIANFKGYAKLLSRIRYVRFIKWYQNQGDPRSSIQFDDTQIANLNANYETIFSADNDPGGVISAKVLDDFVTSLSVGIANNRAVGGVTIEEFYCHSNCHGSCHGSI